MIYIEIYIKKHARDMSIVVVSGKLLLCATKTDNGDILSTDAMEFSINCFDVRMSERNINFGRLLQLILENLFYLQYC